MQYDDAADAATTEGVSTTKAPRREGSEVAFNTLCSALVAT